MPRSRFPFLIGSLRTHRTKHAGLATEQFPFLIGSLRTDGYASYLEKG